jgi:hypothetical protein
MRLHMSPGMQKRLILRANLTADGRLSLDEPQ